MANVPTLESYVSRSYTYALRTGATYFGEAAAHVEITVKFVFEFRNELEILIKVLSISRGRACFYMYFQNVNSTRFGSQTDLCVLSLSR